MFIYFRVRQIILSTTLIIVIVTVIINGGMTFSVLGWLGIPIGVEEDPNEKEPIINSTAQNYRSVDETPSAGLVSTGGPKPDKSLFARQWSGMDNTDMLGTIVATRQATI